MKIAAALLALAPLAFAQADRQALDLAHFDAKLLDFRDKQIIFLGESHGIAINEDLDLALLQYLHREAGVRVYLAEFGYAASFALNQYLATGDERVLDFVMQQSEGSVAWTKERRDYYVRLRQWNASLPAAERVRIVGVDVEHQRGIASRMLAALAQGRTAPAAIADAVARLGRGDFAGIAASVKEHRAEYEQMLGERFFDFELIAGNVQRAADYYAERDSAKGFAIREQAMYDNFLRLYERAGGGRWYGRWGSFHVLQRPGDTRARFANMLNRQGSPVAGKVASILCLYRDSEALVMPGYRTIPVTQSEIPVEPFAATATAPVTLFRVDAADERYRGVQYVALIRNGTASHPMAAGLPPVVVRTVPESGSRNVPVDLAEVRVTFSEPMKDRSWSWCSAGRFEPPPLSNVHYDADGRTIVGTAKLQPGNKYAVWLNKEGGGQCSGFRSGAGETAVPYLLSFETAEK